MAGLADALSRLGCEVTFVGERLVSDERARLGWSSPQLVGGRIELVSTIPGVQSLVANAPPTSVHICQGIRGNGLVGTAQRALARRGLRQWVMMETVDDSGWSGVLKRLEYRRLLALWRRHLEGALAIGYRTAAWLACHGMPAAHLFPFAYFLPEGSLLLEPPRASSERFRFVFVGSFVERKRAALLISALASLNRTDFELEFIGAGRLEESLRIAAEAAFPDRVLWTGQLPMGCIPERIALADCLVLPSRFDGWGAVVSEALMVGTPAICSDGCGVAGVVRASGTGGVFQSGDHSGLAAQLASALETGCLPGSKRLALADWARCLGADAGARYLLQILDFTAGHGIRPAPLGRTGRLIQGPRESSSVLRLARSSARPEAGY